MITIGYYFADEGSWNKLCKSKVSEFPWFTTNDESKTIDVPCFTKAEIREINRLLPGTSSQEIHDSLPYLNLADIEKYAKIYKYYPNFLDSPYYA